MNFKDLNISSNNNYNTLIFNDKEIKVYNYLPIGEKFDLIMVALQKSIVDNVINPLRLECFFNLNVVYLYTDLEFDVDDRADEAGLYDKLYTSGLLTQIIAHMDTTERDFLCSMFDQCLEVEKQYRTTFSAVVSKLVDDMPKNAEAARNIVDNFDKEKYSAVLNMLNEIRSK